jgi:hypothetical protein
VFRPCFIEHCDGGGLLLYEPNHALKVGTVGHQPGLNSFHIRNRLFHPGLSSSGLGNGHLDGGLGSLEFGPQSLLPGDGLLPLMLHFRNEERAERLPRLNLITDVDIDVPEVPRDFRHDVGLEIRMDGGWLGGGVGDCRADWTYHFNPRWLVRVGGITIPWWQNVSTAAGNGCRDQLQESGTTGTDHWHGRTAAEERKAFRAYFEPLPRQTMAASHRQPGWIVAFFGTVKSPYVP